MTAAAASEFRQWLAVADVAHKWLVHAKATNAMLPHEVERWRRVQRNALLEAERLLFPPAMETSL